jgi:polysaccharide pyruvyl transferase WcaK-like protein
MQQEKKHKIGIIWANPYNKNLGVGALAYSSIVLLNDVAKENKLDVEFSIFGSSIPTPDCLRIKKGTSISFSNIYGMDFYSLKSKINLLLFPERFQRNAILDFDYIFDIAEGDGFTDSYGDENFQKILNSKRFFSKKNKKQILLPQTIGPFKNPMHEKEAFKVMSKLNNVISRDQQTYDYLAKFLPKEKIAKAIDVSFYMPFERNKFENGKINVGINVSALLWNGGSTGNNQGNLKTDYKKLIRNTLSYFIAIENVQIHLVPHVIDRDFPLEDDYFVSQELMNEFPKLILAPRFDDPIEAKNYISGMDFFSGARLHACIAAFSTGVPVFPMASSTKFDGLFVDTLAYEWMGDCVNDSEDRVFDLLKEAFNTREQLKTKIEEANTIIVKPRLQLLKDILSETLRN